MEAMKTYLYETYTKGNLTRMEVETGFAARAVDAILAGNEDILYSPFTANHRNRYHYGATAMRGWCNELGLSDFVRRMIADVELLHQNAQVAEMMDKVTDDHELRRKLYVRIAATIWLRNPRLMQEHWTMWKEEEELQRKLKDSGIIAFVKMAMND